MNTIFFCRHGKVDGSHDRLSPEGVREISHVKKLVEPHFGHGRLRTFSSVAQRSIETALCFSANLPTVMTPLHVFGSLYMERNFLDIAMGRSFDAIHIDDIPDYTARVLDDIRAQLIGDTPAVVVSHDEFPVALAAAYVHKLTGSVWNYKKIAGFPHTGEGVLVVKDGTPNIIRHP